MIWLWISFIALVLALLALDLGVFNRKAHAITVREALLWTAFWIALSLLFNVALFFMYTHHWFGLGLMPGHTQTAHAAALQFFTGYIIEKSLSLDNIFIIALIFNYFHVPLEYQHRTLFWGILGALVLRGAMIGAGAALIHRFSWTIYVFGCLLLLTALKMLVSKHENVEPDKNPLVRLARRVYPVTPRFEREHFFARLPEGRRAITPLFLVLLVIESSDVMFAVDSIPAIFAVTRDPFLVFTSNVFAILGLRSLYFALAAVMDKFYYLKTSLVFLLAFVGVKMLASHSFPIPTLVSLAVIVAILGAGVAASVVRAKRILVKDSKND